MSGAWRATGLHGAQAVPTPCVHQRPPRPVQTGGGRSVDTVTHSARLFGSPAPLRVVRSPVVFLVATPLWPPAAALPVWTFCSAQFLRKTATLVPSR